MTTARKYYALVIEDDKDLAYITSEALRSLGFEVTMIHDGAHALSHLVEFDPPHLIVLDMHLPHYSGMNVLRMMYGDSRLLDTRVMVTTADVHLADEILNKADLVLVKPLSFTEIREGALKLVPNVSGGKGNKV